MAKLASFAMFISLAVTMPWVESLEDGHNRLKWAHRIQSGKKVVTKLQFYFHDTPSGKNPSVVQVAEAAVTNTSPTRFGAVMVADDPLTEGPDPTSKLVGRAQGLYGSAGQTIPTLIMNMNYGFTDGIYNESSFSIAGLNPISHTVREMGIVGGTGLFRMARGYVIAHTHWFDPTTGDAIVGYNVTIVASLSTENVV